MHIKDIYHKLLLDFLAAVAAAAAAADDDDVCVLTVQALFTPIVTVAQRTGRSQRCNC